MLLFFGKRHKRSFNSTLVQLKDPATAKSSTPIPSFNSTLVQLKVGTTAPSLVVS